RECLKALCLFRLANPPAELRISGGREVHLRSMQAMGLDAANSMFVSDYLTTKGQPAEADFQMVADLAFEITVGAAQQRPRPRAQASVNSWMRRSLALAALIA